MWRCRGLEHFYNGNFQHPSDTLGDWLIFQVHQGRLSALAAVPGRHVQEQERCHPPPLPRLRHARACPLERRVLRPIRVADKVLVFVVRALCLVSSEGTVENGTSRSPSHVFHCVPGDSPFPP